ncbi:MFS transporter [Youhaiella tibetensis]|nr:MFS transporter [Youhaiella tibetensis]GGF25145.1 MFS transporter [Youhaiella tibetensis]
MSERVYTVERESAQAAAETVTENASTIPEPQPPARPAPPPFVPFPMWKAAIYAASSVVLGLTQGLGLNLITANLTNLQAYFGATQQEVSWLPAAYFATNMTGTLLMFKIRNQFGMRRFAEIGIIVYVLLVVAHMFSNDLRSALIVRAMMGVAAAPLSTLAFFYMLEWLPPARKMTIGICFGMIGNSLALPLARVMSPQLLQNGEWHGLYLMEVGLALVALAVIFLVPITHPPRQKSFDRDDLISFPLLATGFGSLAVVLSMGRAYWWFEAPWLGVLGATGIGSLVLLALVELHRKQPMIDLRWLFTPDMLTFAGALIAVRILLSEQSVGAIGLFTVLGMGSDQLLPLFGIITVVTVAATFWLTSVIKPQRTPYLHLLALVMVAVAAWMDAHSSVLSRPEQFYVSQAIMSFAAAIFLPPAMLHGFARAMAKGPQYILSFLTVFLTTQTLGGLLGSATMTTFVALREQFHSNVMAQGITLLDPMVAQRIQAYGGAYAKVLTDPALRDAKGLALLGQSATQQANVLAYNDLFMVIFVATLATIAVLLIHLALGAVKKTAAQPKAQPA